MGAGRHTLGIFYDIIERTEFKEKCVCEQATDEFIRHLMHDELNVQERGLVENHHLYDWLFECYYTEEERRMAGF